MFPPMQTLSERIRARVREEMKRQKMSQRDIAGVLKWDPKTIRQGQVELEGTDELDQTYPGFRGHFVR